MLAERLGLAVPLVQAPMAGTATPALAAAVSEAGGLGSIALGAATVPAVEAMLAELRARTARPFNVNLFVHAPAVSDSAREAAWLAALAPEFAAFGAEPPPALREIYPSFVEDTAMLRVVLAARPAVVSFHFGLPTPEQVAAFKAVGCLLLATATSLAEAEAAQRAGMDAVVAQGYEAGGHRGVFEPDARDDCLGTLPLVRLLAARGGLPVIAAGGIMDGAGMAAARALGAGAAQLGTAFVLCPESAADAGHRNAFLGGGATVITRAISGRPARCLRNRFTDWEAAEPQRRPPAYPIAYDAGKALNAAALRAGEPGYGAHWAGQGAALARARPAAALVAELAGHQRA